GREDLAVAPPRQLVNFAGVAERRRLLAVTQVAELNAAAADDGQPAAVRMEWDPLRRRARGQVLPFRAGKHLIDADRFFRLVEGYQPAIRTKGRKYLTDARLLYERLAAAQVPDVVMAVSPVVVSGQVSAVRAELAPHDPGPEPGQGGDLLAVRGAADAEMTL